jgi:hypothetical protein
MDEENADLCCVGVRRRSMGRRVKRIWSGGHHIGEEEDQ